MLMQFHTHTYYNLYGNKTVVIFGFDLFLFFFFVLFYLSLPLSQALSFTLSFPLVNEIPDLYILQPGIVLIKLCQLH